MDPTVGKAVILKFVHMLCAGDSLSDSAQHTRLLDWLAHAVQHPNTRCETALCVLGPQGCGKSGLWNIIRHLLQTHGHCIDVKARGWWGENNGYMRDTVCIHIGDCGQHEFMDELVPGLRAAMDDGHLRVRELYQPSTAIQMRARVVVSTIVALEVAENDIGHFTFIQCSNARVGDQAHFQALYAAIHDAGTISAVREFLYHRPLSAWARVRARVRARAVVLYWLGLTEHLMAPAGVAEARDRADYEVDFM